MPWSTLFCSLLGRERRGRIPERCMLSASTLTHGTRSDANARRHTSECAHMHAGEWMPSRKLGNLPRRGITWLLGNSVVLPQRPGYFRLLICLFFLCPRVSVGPVTACVSVQRDRCPVWCLFMHTVLTYFILVFILLWLICGGSNPGGRCSTGVVMGWGGRVGTWQGSPQEHYKSHFSWCDSTFLTAIFALGTYYELISYLLCCHFLPLRITANLLRACLHHSIQPLNPAGWFGTTAATSARFFFLPPPPRIACSRAFRAARLSNASRVFCRCRGWNRRKVLRHRCGSYRSL